MSSGCSRIRTFNFDLLHNTPVNGVSYNPDPAVCTAALLASQSRGMIGTAPKHKHSKRIRGSDVTYMLLAHTFALTSSFWARRICRRRFDLQAMAGRS
jgi:hypothetical protein